MRRTTTLLLLAAAVSVALAQRPLVASRGTQPAGKVTVNVSWQAFLQRHDPVWFLGAGTPTGKVVCNNVSGYDTFPQRLVVPSIGTYQCSNNATCVQDSALRCDALSGCNSFALSPRWHSAMTSQLFGASNVSGSEPNPDWTLYIRNASAPGSKVCKNVTTGSGKPWTDWVDGPFVGNGLVGGLFRFDKASLAGPRSVLRFDLGRVDVWDRRVKGGPGYSDAGALYNKPRLPIGHMEITLPGSATNVTGEFRIDLYRAEVRAQLRWPGGMSLSLRALAPYTEASGLVLEVNHTGGEAPAVAFVPEPSASTRGHASGYLPNPAPIVGSVGGVNVSVQPLLAGGDYGVGTSADSTLPNRTLYWIAIASDWPRNTSGATAASVVQSMSARGLSSLAAAHQAAWRANYPASFLSVGQDRAMSTALEGFYWIQQYKLASAIRPGGPALDLMGPWFQPSGWLFYWFDLNGR